MLLVFAFSITPKRFLHSVFAAHADRSQKNSNKPCQVNNAGYNCDNENVVAESAFLCGHQSFQLPVFVAFLSNIFKNNTYHSVNGIYPLLRGPPVNI